MERLLDEPARDGTWSEEYRAYCEANTVRQWPHAKRLEFYSLVAKARGSQGMRALVAHVRELHAALTGGGATDG